MDEKKTPKAESPEPYFIVPPPASVTVDHERKPILYLPSGKVLIRRAGY